jgi:hypothetical protein
MGWNGQERRQKRRYGVKGSTIRYRKGRWLSFLKAPSPLYLLLNFSEIGAHFISKEALAPGRPLSVVMTGPVSGGSAFVAATAVWSRKSARAARVLKLMLEGALLDNVEISTKSYLKEIERL